MRSDAPDGEKEFETAGFFIFGGLSLIMAILKLVNWNSPLAKPSRKGDKFFDHKRFSETRALVPPGLSSLTIVVRMWAKSRNRIFMPGEVREN